MSPLEAVAYAQTDPQNGRTIASCHIEGNMTGWGMSYVPTFVVHGAQAAEMPSRVGLPYAL